MKIHLNQTVPFLFLYKNKIKNSRPSLAASAIKSYISLINRLISGPEAGPRILRYKTGSRLVKTEFFQGFKTGHCRIYIKYLKCCHFITVWFANITGIKKRQAGNEQPDLP